LQEFVSSIFIFRADLKHIASNIVCPFPPTPQNYIYFYLNDAISTQKNGEDAFIKKPGSITVGPQLTKVNLSIGKDHFMLGIAFHPASLYRLLGMPMTTMFDIDIESYNLFGRDATLIYDKLKESESWIEMKNIVESFLFQKLSRLKALIPFDFAVKQMMSANGNISIEKVASLSCLSLRQFERKCLERIGLPPKLFARLIRFSNAYRLKERKHHLSWTSIAHLSGYYDQMHFIKDFKEFAGVTPSFIQHELEATPLRLQNTFRY
jgi:AraC-type DNA-binding domain-containing proteins